jgi:hypothetical protein
MYHNLTVGWHHPLSHWPATHWRSRVEYTTARIEGAGFAWAAVTNGGEVTVKREGPNATIGYVDGKSHAYILTRKPL